jgi:hypothetical protein
MLTVNVVPPAHVSVSAPPQLLSHHADELEPKGLRVPEIEAFGETDAGVMHTQGDVFAFGP